MPKPTSIPTWATDATYTDPGETWDGTSNKTDPGAGKRTQGWVPTETPGPEQFNFDQNLVGDWLEWLDSHWNTVDEHVYPAPKTREIRIGAREFMVDGGSATYSWDTVTTTSRPGVLSTTSDGFIRARLPLNRYLPQGAIIDQIRIAAFYDSTGGSPALEMKLEKFRVSFSSWVASGIFSFDSTTQLDIKNSGGSTRVILDSGTGLAETIGPTYGLVLFLEMIGDGQIFYEVEIDYSDVGLINQ